ncbi:hypothetical protein B1209_11935 [Raoultella planticola]|uniref:Uncharacterized protein n=2 Tax=Raoultella TaxID=160674 RepID=A0A443VJC3_RAOPL|nr:MULTISPECIES: hypothetical protein [Raoultella]MDU4420713.1 hypothetical protein [Raoultella sp.]HDX8332314.1 hypothetical protein [Raoultella ornithinolytica CD1_MRS_4]ATM05296.1 hypothetical protein CRT62_11980 [Raoultella planticola]ATM17497.1 hypothetical protein CRN15_22870 [Raoultella planticola]ATM20976.1 hypothetical protein CRN13_11455 [Raoultella ornithinolytica]
MLVKRLFFQHIRNCYIIVTHVSGGKQKMTQTVTPFKCNNRALSVNNNTSTWFAQGKGLFL